MHVDFACLQQAWNSTSGVPAPARALRALVAMVAPANALTGAALYRAPSPDRQVCPFAQ